MKQLSLFVAGVLLLTLSACSSGNKADQTESPLILVRIGKPQLHEDYDTVSVSGTIPSPEEPPGFPFSSPAR